MFTTPKRHTLARNRVFWRILRQNPSSGLGCSELQEPKIKQKKQELSYRKQIGRQLRTQYAEVIYDNPVTLKSRLTVTQGHWKRNH